MARPRNTAKPIVGNDGDAIGDLGNRLEIDGDGGSSSETGTAPILNPAELGTLGNPAENPAELGTENPAPKRRGRKPGSRTKTATTKETQNLASTLRDTLQSIHGALYFFTQSDLWQITPEETDRVADRAATVASFYCDMEIPTKYGAWFNFAAALGSVYGMRLLAYRMISKAAPSSAQQSQQFQAYPAA